MSNLKTIKIPVNIKLTATNAVMYDATNRVIFTSPEHQHITFGRWVDDVSDICDMLNGEQLDDTYFNSISFPVRVGGYQLQKLMDANSNLILSDSNVYEDDIAQWDNDVYYISNKMNSYQQDIFTDDNGC